MYRNIRRTFKTLPRRKSAEMECDVRKSACNFKHAVPPVEFGSSFVSHVQQNRELPRQRFWIANRLDHISLYVFAGKAEILDFLCYPRRNRPMNFFCDPGLANTSSQF